MDEKRINIGQFRTLREKLYLTIICFLAACFWLWTGYSLIEQSINATLWTKTEESLDDIWGVYASPLILISYFSFGIFSHFLAIAYIRANAIKVGPEQFPEINDSVIKYAKELQMKRVPDVFVMNGNGVLNAFAARLVFRQVLVLYSDLIEALIAEKDFKQLDAIIAHELGHHVLGHTGFWQWLLMPAELIPFLGLTLSRAREYSADRVMKGMMRDNDPCEKAFGKLACGKVLGARVNTDAYIKQYKNERGFFTWLAERLATHPHTPNRIRALRKFEMKESHKKVRVDDWLLTLDTQ